MDTSHEAAFERRAPAQPWEAWVETVALAAAAIAAGALVDGRDPFLLRRGFPWLALAPLLAGVRYGSGHGVLCAAVQALALAAIAWSSGQAQVPGPIAEVALGWVVAGLVPGKFQDAWCRRRRQLEAHAEELRLRLEVLGRDYHALKLAYDGLRRELPESPSTLFDALEDLRREILRRDPEPLESLGGRILALFAAHASVLAATLHPVDARGRPEPAVAALGTGTAGEGDPLLQHASRLGEVVSVRDLPARSDVLAAVPLVDATGRVHAVVAVRDMPFLALHAETLALLAVLGGQLGDAVACASSTARRAPLARSGGPRALPAPGAERPGRSLDVGA